MLPTEILRNEHRVIEQVLNCLEQMIERCQQSGKLEDEQAAMVITFLQKFADGCHHAKEEDVLFPAMEQGGFPPEGGPTAVMRHEHELGRSCIKGMKENQAASAAGDGKACEQFIEFAKRYIDLLRAHIQKEDQVLFTMAENTLSGADLAEVSKGFENIEHHHVGEGTHEKMLSIANQLAEHYNCKGPDSTGCCCCCGH